MILIVMKSKQTKKQNKPKIAGHLAVPEKQETISTNKFTNIQNYDSGQLTNITTNVITF